MHLARSFAFAATALMTLSQVSVALAQSTDVPSSTGKGIVGGALLGAEVVLLTEAAFDVSPDWLYYVGGAAGAVGGGIAGYFLEHNDTLGSKGNMFLLAGGMLLVIPTTVAVLSATAYEQTAEYTQDQQPKDEPVADPVLPATPTPAPATTPTPAPTPAPVTRNLRQRHRGVLPPPALVGIDAQQRLHWGIPAVEVRDAYSRVELARYGVQQRTELRVPLLRVAF